MARMHSRKRGKSGSAKPKDSDLSWVRYSPEEIEKLIIKFGEKGLQSADIGRMLRDTYGIPDVKRLVGKKISQILKESNNYTELPEDLFNLLKKAVKIKKHMESNKKDLHSKRGLKLTESKIRRLAKYYKAKGHIEQKWTYNIEKAKIIVE